MAAGHAVGTIFAEIDLDWQPYSRAQKKLLQDATSTTLNIEKSYKDLGIKSAQEFDLMRAKIQNAYTRITSDAKTSATDILRAEKAKNDQLQRLNDQQFGHQKSFIDNIKGHWLAASAIIAGSIGAIYKAWDLAKAGAEYEEQETLLGNLSRKYSTTSGEIVSAMAKASDGLIANADLMQIALKGIATGITPAQLIDLANAATILADAAGTDATTALRSLTEGLVSGRVQGLKGYLGTAIDLEAQFGSLASKMSDAEKAQALFSITMISASKLQAENANAVESSADKLEKLETRYKNITQSVSNFFKSLVVSIVDAPAKINEMSSSVDLLTGETIQADAAMQSATESLQKEKAEVENIIKPYQDQIELLKQQLETRKANEDQTKKTIAAEKKAAEESLKIEEQLRADRQKIWKDMLDYQEQQDEEREKAMEDMAEKEIKIDNDVKAEWVKILNSETKYYDDQEKERNEILERYAKEDKKVIEDKDRAYRNMYKDLGRYSKEYYNLQLRAIEGERKDYLAKTNDKALTDQWYTDKKKRLDQEMALSSDGYFSSVRIGYEQSQGLAVIFGDTARTSWDNFITGAQLSALGFFSGIEIGYDRMLENQKTWAQGGLALFQTFTDASSRELADFMNPLKEDFLDLENAWNGLLDSMLQSLTQTVADMAVQWAIAKGAQLIGDLFFHEGAWNVAGLQGDERPAILQTGETVLDRERAAEFRQFFGSQAGFDSFMDSVEATGQMTEAARAGLASFGKSMSVNAAAIGSVVMQDPAVFSQAIDALMGTMPTAALGGLTRGFETALGLDQSMPTKVGSQLAAALGGMIGGPLGAAIAHLGATLGLDAIMDALDARSWEPIKDAFEDQFGYFAGRQQMADFLATIDPTYNIGLTPLTPEQMALSWAAAARASTYSGSLADALGRQGFDPEYSGWVDRDTGEWSDSAVDTTDIGGADPSDAGPSGGGYGKHGGWMVGPMSGYKPTLHGRELVLNEDQVKAVRELNAGKGGGRPITFNLYATVADKRAFDEFADKIYVRMKKLDQWSRSVSNRA